MKPTLLLLLALSLSDSVPLPRTFYAEDFSSHYEALGLAKRNFNFDDVDYDEQMGSMEIIPTSHKIMIDGSGHNWQKYPINPYEKVMRSKYFRNPFQQLFLHRARIQSMMMPPRRNYGPPFGGGGWQQ